MKKYQTYKPSGIEWIGEIPSHWDFNKVGNNTYVKGRIGWKGLRSEDFIDEGPYLITGTDFNKDGTINWEQMYHVNQERYDEDIFIQLKDNDVLITKDGTIGKVVHVGNLRGQTCLNSGIFLTRPTNNEYISRFFYWILNSHIFKIFVDYNSGGSTIQHLYQNVFVNFKFPIPSIKEQLKIVQFLDEKTDLVDRLILKKERKITLLKEQRTSLINQVVTKGLNPNVKMKDSGVEWIGKIPEHWTKSKVKYVSTIFGRIGYRGYTVEDIVSEGEGVITISPSNIKNDIFTIEGENTFLSYVKYEESPEIQIFTNDIILVKTGSTIGKTSIIPCDVPKMTINPQLVVLKELKIDNKYFYYQTVCEYFKKSFLVEQTGSTTPTISQEKINGFPILIPSRQEQLQIVEHLDSKIIEIDDLVQLEQKKIDLLKEYRQSLISEVVTGKIKVTTDE
jgi:type I restriction enzyme S subunit